MARSFHVTYKDLIGKTQQKIDAMLEDSHSILHQLAEKRRVKKAVQKQRKIDRANRC